MPEEKGMDFFTKADKNRDGGNASEYPAWMHPQHMEELQESIRQKEYALNNDLIMPSEKMIQRERLRQEKTRLEQIEGSRPSFSDAEIDRIAKVRKILGEEIRSLMFTRDDDRRGLVDAHEEARRLSTPCISIKDDSMLSVVKACGVDRITPDGKITRGQAEKAWKIISRYLGEGSNTEILRKEK